MQENKPMKRLNTEGSAGPSGSKTKEFLTKHQRGKFANRSDSIKYYQTNKAKFNLLPLSLANGFICMVRCFFRIPSLAELASLRRLLPGLNTTGDCNGYVCALTNVR